MTDFNDEILDAPEEKSKPAIKQDWALVASLTTEQIANLVPRLEAANFIDVRLEKETATLNHTGIIPVSATQLGDMKTLLYVKPEEAVAIKAIVDALPKSKVSTPEENSKDQNQYKLWMVLMVGGILFMLFRAFYYFMISF